MSMFVKWISFVLNYVWSNVLYYFVLICLVGKKKVKDDVGKCI